MLKTPKKWFSQGVEIKGFESAIGQFLVYQAEDGKLKLDVRLEGESVWLTQPLMAELFQTTQQNISQHVLNIYEEGELAPEATHKKFLSVRMEGKREVKRPLDYHKGLTRYRRRKAVSFNSKIAGDA